MGSASSTVVSDSQTGDKSKAASSNNGSFSKSTGTYKKYKELLNKGNIFEHYTRGELLGSGNMASVFRYTRKADGIQLAAKVVEKKTLTEVSEFTNELEILAACGGHKHILDLHDIYEDKDNFYLLTDLLEGGELFDRICDMGVYTEQIAKDLIIPILGALSHIHSKQVLHRDVKPENLLLMDTSDTASLKIADFGVAAWLPDLEKTGYPKCGTPEYLAPEMYGPRNCKYGKPVDVWALGCVMFIMLCGWHPFQVPENPHEQKSKIIQGDLMDLEEEDISDEAKDCIHKMLCVDPAERYTIDQLLEHPWLKSPKTEESKAAQHKSLSKTQVRLKKFLASRLRKVVLGIAFSNAVRSKSTIVQSITEEEERAR